MEIKRKSEWFNVLLDEDLRDVITSFNWNIDSYGYVLRFYFEPGGASRKPDKTAKRGKVMLHDFVWFLKTGEILPEGLTIDHINRDTLDNRFCNLRKATRNMQTYNQKKKKDTGSSVVGVYRTKKGKWCARIKVKGRTHSLGCYHTEEEAILARYRKEIELFGEVLQ